MFRQLLAATVITSMITIAPGTTHVAAAPTQWHILRQADAGQTLTSIACPGRRTCYVAGAVILRTRTGGSTWDLLVDQVPRGSSNIACPSTTTCYASTAGGYLLISRDRGAIWIRKRLSSRPLGPIACPALRVCYTVVFSRTPGQRDIVLVTHDGGTQWIRHGLPISRDLPAIACPAMGTCQLAGGGYTVRTADGGKHWTIRNNGMDTGIGTNGSEFMSLACPAISVCYLVSAAYGREWTGGSIYRTRDGGMHWASIYNDASPSGASERLRGIACVDTSTCYAVGDGPYVLYTSSVGSRWSKQPSGAGITLNAVMCARGGGCFAVGAAGTIVSNALLSGRPDPGRSIQMRPGTDGSPTGAGTANHTRPRSRSATGGHRRAAECHGAAAWGWQ